MDFKKLIKNLLFSVVAMALFFGGLEGALFIAKKVFYPSDAGDAALTNRFDPDKSSISISKELKDEMADTHLLNIEKNPLTYPDKDMIFHVRPNPTHAPIHDYTGINSLGYRGPDFDKINKNSDETIMILADSCGFGWSLPNHKDVFSYQLGQMLEGGEKSYSIYNLSQPGFSSYQTLLLFKRWYKKIKPTYMVVYVGWNDIWYTNMLDDEETIRVLKVSNHPLMKSISATNTYFFLKRAIARVIKVTKKGEGQHKVQHQATRAVRVPVNKAVGYYDQMVNAALADGVKVVFLMPPFTTWQYPTKHYISDYNKAVYDTYKDKAVFLSVTPMRHYSPKNIEYYLGDGFHPNRKGSELIANELYEVIVKAGKGAQNGDFIKKVNILGGQWLPKIIGENTVDPQAMDMSGKARIAYEGKTETGTLVYGPYSDVEPGEGNAIFRMKVDRLTAAPIAEIDITHSIGKVTLAKRTLTGADFKKVGEYVEFTLNYKVDKPMTHLETRVMYKGGATLSVDIIRLQLPLKKLL